MEHTTPITFPEDETFDIGQDTRTPLALIEYRYDTPFKFTGKINKVTFNLGDEKLTAEEQEIVHKGPRAGARPTLTSATRDEAMYSHLPLSRKWRPARRCSSFRRLSDGCCSGRN